MCRPLTRRLLFTCVNMDLSMPVLNIINRWLFFLLFLIVNGQIEIIPKIQISKMLITKFHLIQISKSHSICKISLIESNNKKKRSLSEYKEYRNEQKCPLPRRKLKPSSSIKILNDSYFISETPESIVIGDEPTRDSESFTNEPQLQTHDQTLITSKRDLTETLLQPRTKIHLSPEKSSEQLEIQIEESSDWQLNYETIGVNNKLLYLKYTRPVEAPVKAVYELNCTDENSSNFDRAILIINLIPYVNKTKDDVILNKSIFDYYLEQPPCLCDLKPSSCDKNCCCDKNCSIEILKFFGCSEPFYKTGKDLKQPSGYECTSKSLSFLCVTSQTSPFIDWYHPPEPILKTLKMFDERVPNNNKNMDWLLKPPTFHWDTSHYVQGSAIQIKLKNSDIGVWVFPKSHFGDTCSITSPGFFQMNQKSACTTRVTSSTCGEKGLLNINHYVPWGSANYRYWFLRELFGDESVPVNVTYICADNYDFHWGPLQQKITSNCRDKVLVSSFNSSLCLNPVIEAKYKFYWRGPRIEKIEITLLTIPFVRTSDSIKQYFELDFIHKSVSKIEKKSQEIFLHLAAFQSDSKGVCLDDFVPVPVGESIQSSCMLNVDYETSLSCSSYRDFLCRRYEKLWQMIEMNIDKSENLILSPNFTLCNSSSQFYNTCHEIPTNIFVEAIFVDLAILNVQSFLKILGVRMSLISTPCFPPVGFGFEEMNNSLYESKTNEDSKHTILCKPKQQILISSKIQFKMLNHDNYLKLVETFRGQVTIFDFLLPQKTRKELFYIFSSRNIISLAYNLAIFMFLCFVFIVSVLFLYKFNKKL